MKKIKNNRTIKPLSILERGYFYVSLIVLHGFFPGLVNQHMSC